MTKHEKEEFRKWNIEITRNELKADEIAIANTTTVSQEERINDIRLYIKWIEAAAKGKAVSNILHIC